MSRNQDYGWIEGNIATMKSVNFPINHLKRLIDEGYLKYDKEQYDLLHDNKDYIDKCKNIIRLIVSHSAYFMDIIAKKDKESYYIPGIYEQTVIPCLVDFFDDKFRVPDMSGDYSNLLYSEFSEEQRDIFSKHVFCIWYHEGV